MFPCASPYGGYADNSTEVSEQITSQMSSIVRIPNRKFSFVSWEKNVTSFLGERYYCTRTQSPLDIVSPYTTPALVSETVLYIYFKSWYNTNLSRHILSGKAEGVHRSACTCSYTKKTTSSWLCPTYLHTSENPTYYTKHRWTPHRRLQSSIGGKY